MRIGIDARFFGPGQKGLGRYLQKLVGHLEKVDLNNQYVIFLRRDNWDEYQPSNPNFKKVLADYRWYTLEEQVMMPIKIWRAKVDLIHFPHFNIPVFYSGPFVVTIHDLVLKRFPTRRASTLGPIRYWLKDLAYQLVIWLAVKRAKKIVAVSGYTKEDILRYFRVKPEKIEVIYEGAPEANPGRPGERPAGGKPYLLYVGNAYPHKNLERLILAFQKLTQEEKIDLKLVLVGQLDYFYQRLQKQFSSLPGLVFTDFVSDEELASLYQRAALYVFPSLGEGFGLPPLEAMSYGLPVVSSQATCLPEILGRAAVYFNPEDIEDMTEKIKQVLKDKKIQERLVSQGFEKIKEYHWSKTAQEALAVYQKSISFKAHR
jgi:glycosyltransferase involved in cell wall biosynthesis